MDAVGPLDRPFEGRGVGYGEPDVEPERESQVVGGAEVRGIGERNLHQVLFEEADGEYLRTARELLGEEAARLRLDLDAGEIDELQPVLLGERFGDRFRENCASRDEQLPEPHRLRKRPLLGQSLLQPLAGQAACAHEQFADRRPRAKRACRPKGLRELRGLHRPSIGQRAAEREG